MQNGSGGVEKQIGGPTVHSCSITLKAIEVKMQKCMRNNWPSHSCLDLEQEEPEKHRATPKPLGAPSGDHFLTQPVGHTPSGPSQTLSSGGGGSVGSTVDKAAARTLDRLLERVVVT